MTKFITIAALLAAGTAFSNAAQVIDLLDGVAWTHGEERTDFQTAGITAETVSSWLESKSKGAISWTPMNGNNGAAINPSITSADGGYTFTFVNRKAYAGSVVGITSELGSDVDLASVTNLKFSFADFTGPGVAVNGDLYLVYQVGGNWLSQSATSLSFVSGGAGATVSVDLEEGQTLSSFRSGVIHNWRGNFHDRHDFVDGDSS